MNRRIEMNCNHCQPTCCTTSQCWQCQSSPAYYLPSSTSDCQPCSGVTCASGHYFCASACGPGVDNGCRACAVCGTGYYQTAACTSTTNTVCAACSAISCPAGHYWLSSACGGTSNGCTSCTDCVIGSSAAFGKAYSDVCGGPSPYNHNPPECLTPGEALCEACFNITAFQNNGLPEDDPNYIQFCDNERPDAWWFLGDPAKDVDDLDTCCSLAKVAWDNGDCDFPDLMLAFPGATKRSCTYNMVYDCMNIAATWPNPQPYPTEPQAQ